MTGWGRWGPAVALGVAVAAGLVGWQVGQDDAPPRPGAPVAVAVSSDAPRHASLAELTAAADVVVRGEVVGAARGRVFGDPGSEATIESRVLTLRVEAVLHGAGPGQGGQVLVEEEGWDGDGAPLVVDGAEPSQVGDAGIWFLSSIGSGEEHRYVMVGAEGRYLVEGSGLRGARGDDPLIARLEALGPAGLTAAVTALP